MQEIWQFLSFDQSSWQKSVQEIEKVMILSLG